MNRSTKIVATALAAALASSAFVVPSYATNPCVYTGGICHPPKPPKVKHGGGSSATGKIVVGCIFGSALGLITAALAKGRILNDKKVELTHDEVWPIALTCGLATFPVIASFRQQPQTAKVVKARF